jgi:hypothetical protein
VTASTPELALRWHAAAGTRFDPAALEHYRTASVQRGVGYRLSGERAGRRSYSAALELLRRDETGTRADLTIVPTLTPALVPAAVERTLADFGPLLVAAIRTCAEVIHTEPRARQFTTLDAKGEDIGLTGTADSAWSADWIRVDYLLDPASPWAPQVIDINLMPGMTHTCAAVHELFLEHLLPVGDPHLRDVAASLRHYDTTPIDTLRENYARACGQDEVLFVVRRGHGLEPEVQLASRSLTARGNIRSRVVHAHELAALLNEDTDGAARVFVRQARATTKHAEPGTDELETAGVNELLRLASTGRARVAPGPHMYLENHAWPYFIRALPDYADAIEQRLGTTGWQLLTALLVDTGIVTGGRILWPDGTAESVTEQTLTNRVIKRGSSTGAEDVTILAGSRGRRRYREQAAGRLGDHTESGYVIQPYIDTPKQTQLAVVGNRVVPVSGHIRYGAFYARGTYMGGYALLSTDSRIVHGGSSTHWVPLIGITKPYSTMDAR